MANTSKIVIILCGYFWLTEEAARKVLYEISSPKHVSGLASCGVRASGFGNCAARVTSNACEPLARGWCETEDMSEEGVYIIKTKVIEIIQEKRSEVYNRTMPIILSPGSNVELKFVLHSGWTVVSIDLYDESGNNDFHAKMESSTGRCMFNSWMEGIWGLQGGYQSDFPFKLEVEYTYSIYCISDRFWVYINDGFVGDLEYAFPIKNIHQILFYHSGTPTDLYQVTYC